MSCKNRKGEINDEEEDEGRQVDGRGVHDET